MSSTVTHTSTDVNCLGCPPFFYWIIPVPICMHGFFDQIIGRHFLDLGCLLGLWFHLSKCLFGQSRISEERLHRCSVFGCWCSRRFQTGQLIFRWWDLDTLPESFEFNMTAYQVNLRITSLSRQAFISSDQNDSKFTLFTHNFTLKFLSSILPTDFLSSPNFKYFNWQSSQDDQNDAIF